MQTSKRSENLAPLLPSKLAMPSGRAERVYRPRLVQQLTEGRVWPLVLVAAPAGFGKTTLLVDMLAAQHLAPANVAWLTLDAADNDPARFWNYVVAALDGVQSGCAGPVLALSREPLLPPEDVIVGQLRAGLARLSRPVALVLDDYHVIEAPTIHRGVSLLLEQRPRHLQVVVSSRADPPLPLSRLRARGQLLEIRAADLRFTPMRRPK